MKLLVILFLLKLYASISIFIQLMMIKKVEYSKDLMKIKFGSDDNLPSNKQLKFPTMTIIIRSVFEDDDKMYPQIYLDNCLHES